MGVFGWAYNRIRNPALLGTDFAVTAYPAFFRDAVVQLLYDNIPNLAQAADENMGYRAALNLGLGLAIGFLGYQAGNRALRACEGCAEEFYAHRQSQEGVVPSLWRTVFGRGERSSSYH